MTSINTYRANAVDCMRLAAKDTIESDRPLWATLARSWLQLCEQVDRSDENPKFTMPDAGMAVTEMEDPMVYNIPEDRPAQN